MNVLHYSFSLSACPKCHLLVCKHTSLADLDFDPTEQKQSITECCNTTISIRNNIKNPSQGMNFYKLPSTTSDNGHSWTTFGTNSIESINTLNNETICDNIPFANENIIHSSLPLTPTLNQIVRTQSERITHDFKRPICLTKSFSFSTMYNKSSSFPHLKQEGHLSSKSHSSSRISFLLILILIISFLIINTLDIVLLYIYYHTNSFYFILFICIIILCDIILWMNNLIQLKTISSRLLLIPFVIRLYLLYQLVEFMTIILDKNFIKNENTQILDSSSSSSSTTTTLETNISQTTDCPILRHHPPSSFRMNKQRLFQYLALFYLVHTGCLAFINLYFWSNNFQPSTKSSLYMNYFIPQWKLNDDLLLSTSSINAHATHSPIPHWQLSNNEHKHFARRIMPSNWTHSLLSPYIPLSVRLPSSSAFVLTSILYYLIINYSFLSTFLVLERFSFLVILSILSRLCLIITRLYTFIFLLRLDAWWLTMTFIIVHLTLMITLLFDRSKCKHKRNTIFIQIFFSFITHSSIDDISITALISLENISIFLHRLYLETFSLPNETTLRLIVFLSILISLQIIGFIFDILSKNIFYRTETTTKTVTKL